MKELQAALSRALEAVAVRAWRLHLKTPEVYATVPMLRGVWGAALRAADEPLYQSVFEGGAAGTPRYLMRPAPREAAPAPVLEFLLFGHADTRELQTFWAAWEAALRTGLGPARRPAILVDVRPLAWEGTPLSSNRCQPGFHLASLPWPCGDPSAACRLIFDEPLRLLRDGKLIDRPTLADLTLAALRRVHALGGIAANESWADRGAWLDVARTVRAEPWRGRPLDLVRYSGRQKRDVEMHGVAGELVLPAGPGPLADLLAAAMWTHLGKSTVVGLGQLRVDTSD